MHWSGPVTAFLVAFLRSKAQEHQDPVNLQQRDRPYNLFLLAAHASGNVGKARRQGYSKTGLYRCGGLPMPVLGVERVNLSLR